MTALLYAAKGGSSASDLYTLDPATGAATSIGPMGYALTGLAFDPTSGILYGSTSNNSPVHPRALITVDPATGTAALIDLLHTGGGNLTSPIPDICFDSSGQMYGIDISGAGFFAQVDKTNGFVTEFPSMGLTDFGDGLDVSPLNSLLYAFPRGGPNGAHPCTGVFDDRGSYYTINVSTGVATLIGCLSGGPDSDNDTVNAASFDASGVAWAIFNDFVHTVWKLVTVDVNTGAIASVANLTGSNWDALAWGPAAPAGPFTLHASPGSLTRPPGSSVTSTISSTLDSGSPENITLTVDNAGSFPTGVTASLAPTTISDDGGSSTLLIHTTVATPLGTFIVRVKGDDGSGGTATVDVTVHVIAPPPAVAHIAS